MLKKLSYRDTPEDLLAMSIYYSSAAARALKETPGKFPGYNDSNSTAHEAAVNAILQQLDDFVGRSAEAHGVDKAVIMQRLKNMVSEGIA